MREIFSLRFFAAVGVVIGLFLLLTLVFGAGEAIDGDSIAGPGIEPHRIDLVDQIAAVRSADGSGLAFTDDGLLASDVELILDGTRSVRVVTDTPGVDHCPQIGRPGGCAIVADLIGEAVVWFALVPMGDNRTVDLPAIDILDDGLAHLVNGWQLPYASVLDRRCEDDQGNEVEFASYREFRDVLGDDFTSVYSLETRRLEAVVCNERVPYAPEPAPTTLPDPASTTVPPTAPTTGPPTSVGA